MRNSFIAVRNFFLLIFIIIGSVFLFNGCGNENNKTTNTKAEVKKDSVKIAIAETNISFDKKYDDIAHFIAGLPISHGSSIDSSLLGNKEWLRFSKNMDAQWGKYDTIRLMKISAWSKKEISGKANSKILFYPFSGPDFLNATLFFPNVDTLVLVGLEPRGKVPHISVALNDSLSKYLNDMERSLYAILHFSFFRTNSMKVDLQNEDVNGTTPVMMLFLARTGNTITDIQRVYVNKSGMVVHDSSATADSIKTKGMEITFMNTIEKKIKKLFYFSVDLSNAGLKNKAPEFITYIHHLGTVNTFLKSASYLMHKPYFSVIRSAILDQSDLVLQDDSGIPLSFFASSDWENKFYGIYSKTIPMFSKCFQTDLQQAYNNPENEKPLDFGIGYQWHKNKSNLMLSTKKKKA